MNNKPALLALADGTILQGESVGAEGCCIGELVFNTAMTGFQEMLSDPSYAKQIITFTAAHVGNTGCNSSDMESSRAWAAGCVMSHVSSVPSNFRAEKSFPEWLERQGVVAISGIDARYLTQRLRDQGSIGACISTQVDAPEEAIRMAQSAQGISGGDLASTVSRQTIERWHSGLEEWSFTSNPLRYHVVAYDFGVKHSILRILHDLGCHLTLVPAKTSAEEVLALNPEGIFLSNGPGDPFACDYAIEATKTFLKTDIPLFGICLGFQILGLACGANSLKMPLGHHGANHPVLDLDKQKVYITSQNHGFAIDEQTLPDTVRVTHRSLFDQSLQGIMHREKMAFGFQGHPEASPGPHDIVDIFNRFIQFMKSRRESTRPNLTGVC